MENSKSIVFGNARFSALSPSLVRIEYSEKCVFEDRPTIRVNNRPEVISFDAVNFNDKNLILNLGEMVLEFFDDGNVFSAENLKITNKTSGKLIWRPGQKDYENLGGAPMSMDNVSRSIIPNGVHPADEENFDSDNYNLWNFCANKANNDFAICDLHSPKGEDLGLEQYLKMVDIEKNA